MSEYTLTTNQVRHVYAFWNGFTPVKHDEMGDNEMGDNEKYKGKLTAFDRWLAQHDAEVARQALEEAADEVHREARHQAERARRNALDFDYAADYSAERGLLVEQALRDRAAALAPETTTKETR